MKRFEYVIPGTFEDAAKAFQDGATLKAAGLDLLDRMKAGIEGPEKIVSIHRVKEADFIRETKEGAIEIGALAKLSPVAEHPAVAKSYPVLAQALLEAATPQIRNMATLAGNLCQRPRCWYYRLDVFPCLKKGGSVCYAFDGENRYHALFDGGPCHIVHPSNAATVLRVLEADVELVGGRVIPLDRFFVLPNENLQRENVLESGDLIRLIRLPVRWKGKGQAYREVREKQSFDWALAAAAVTLDLDGGTCREARVVLGAVAPIPKRMENVESFLKGKKITGAVAEEAGEKACAGASPLSQNRYKIRLVKAMVRRALCAAAGIAE